MATQEAQTYRQVTMDQEWSTHSPLFSWDNTYPGVELLLSRLDPSDSSHAAAVCSASQKCFYGTESVINTSSSFMEAQLTRTNPTRYRRPRVLCTWLLRPGSRAALILACMSTHMVWALGVAGSPGQQP